MSSTGISNQCRATLTLFSPLISMFSHLIRSAIRPREIHFVYGTRAPAEIDVMNILFLPRIMDLVAAADDVNVTVSLFLTGTGDHGSIEHGKLPNRTFARRFGEADLISAIDGYQNSPYGVESARDGTLCYVCGPPTMTDEVVDLLKKQPGMSERRVLCEKWW